MEDILCLGLSFLGLISTLKGQPLATAVSADGSFDDRPASAIHGYPDDEHLWQARRRARVKERRAAESRRQR
jgi:hypothetical protein